MSKKKKSEFRPDLILRECLRHYLDFEAFVSATGKDVIEHGVKVGDSFVPVTISFLDLQYGLSELAPRKKEAIYYNVILDMKQKDVAEIMNITTVSVGQYVKTGMQQLTKRYFAEHFNELPAAGTSINGDRSEAAVHS